MSLPRLHVEVARIALALPGTGLALAGGGAVITHGVVSRPTRDVDLFTPAAEKLPEAAAAVAAELRRRGHRVQATLETPTFIRLDVLAPDGQRVEVELGVDARIRDAVHLDVGAVLHPEELAADKTLALFGRAYARDLIDVDAFARRYPRDQLLALAAEKDPGFDLRHFVEALAVAAGRNDADFAELGLDAEHAEGLRARARAWADALRPTLDNRAAGGTLAAGDYPHRRATGPALRISPPSGRPRRRR